MFILFTAFYSEVLKFEVSTHSIGTISQENQGVSHLQL